MHCTSTQNGRADSGADNTMTNEQFHEELRKCGFYKVGTGGGCDALVAELKNEKGRSVQIMLTHLDDPCAPDVDEPVHVGIGGEDFCPEVLFILDTAEQVLTFARSVRCAE